MHKADSIGYSTDLCVFFSVQGRVLSAYLKSTGEATMGELALLLAIREAESPVSAEQLADFLFYGIRTVRNMLLSFEDTGLVHKDSNRYDARAFTVALTDEGLAVTDRLASGVYEVLKRCFWKALPEEDFQEVMKSDMRLCLNCVRGCAVDPFGDHSKTVLPIEVDHLVFWRVVKDRWEAIARNRAEISLMEANILHYVCEHDASIISDIAQALMSPKSAVSLGVKRLREIGLLDKVVCAGDQRSNEIFPTERGVSIDRSLFALLDDETRAFHMGVKDSDLGVIKAWYVRMFANMRRNDRLS